jgi:hypothetical protein
VRHLFRDHDQAVRKHRPLYVANWLAHVIIVAYEWLERDALLIRSNGLVSDTCVYQAPSQ